MCLLVCVCVCVFYESARCMNKKESQTARKLKDDYESKQLSSPSVCGGTGGGALGSVALELVLAEAVLVVLSSPPSGAPSTSYMSISE